jgi:SAM-dependent methyltransferase
MPYVLGVPPPESATRLEIQILSELLRPADCRDLLEIGSGTGRLLDFLEQVSGRVVALDSSPTLLRRARAGRPGGGNEAWVVGDGHRLPFADGAFSAVVLVRVFHLSPRPEALVVEIRRVLQPRGVLVLSYYPRPSIRTMQYRLWNHLRSESGSARLQDRVARGGRLEGREGEGAHRSAASTESLLRRGGFELEAQIGAGLDEITGFDLLPESVFRALYRAVPNAWGYPARFVRLRRTAV